MKKRLAAILVAIVVLFTCGCVLESAPAPDISEMSKVDPAEVRTGKVEVNGWLDAVVKYCNEHKDAEGVLVEVTGEMAETSADHEKVDSLLLIMPGSDDTDPEVDATVRPGDDCAYVYFAKPYERTPWRHLISVRGIATLDSSQENRLIIRGAMKAED